MIKFSGSDPFYINTFDGFSYKFPPKLFCNYPLSQRGLDDNVLFPWLTYRLVYSLACPELGTAQPHLVQSFVKYTYN